MEACQTNSFSHMALLVWKILPQSLGVFCTHLEPAECHLQTGIFSHIGFRGFGILLPIEPF